LATTVPTRTLSAAKDIRGLLLSYVRLTKPRIVMLLVITTIPAMILADGGIPSVWLMLATVLGGSVVAGGANAMNMYFDRDIDEIMVRTQERPVPSGQVDPEKAAVFGFALGALGFAFMYLAINPLSAVLTLSAFAFYVIVYTLILKRTTSLNIVIGGAAGAMPPMIGWAAVTNSVSIEAILMFAIVTMWTPPHFWAISINYSSDYKRAGVPMLPVVAGIDATKRQMLYYTVGLVAVTVALAFLSDLGAVYLATALLLGTGFIYVVARLWRSPSVRPARAVFGYSILYLALLFGAIALDTLVLS
jgi:protoheme IX farnesyltransferase